MATRPSILPTANPLVGEAVKHETTRVCHFSGDCIVYSKRIVSYDMFIPRVGKFTFKGVPGLNMSYTWMWRSAVPTTMVGNWTSMV